MSEAADNPRPMNGRPPWKLPAELEPWRKMISGNGEPLEHVMAGPARIQVNAPLALIQQGIEAQVQLMHRLYLAGLLSFPSVSPVPVEPAPEGQDVV